MQETKKTIGIIGFGNMGQAIAERLKSQYKIVVFDKDKNKIRNLKGINTANNNLDLLNKVDTLILAVKPQDFDVVLREIKPQVKDKLVISIAAGIETAYIEKVLGNTRVIRAMPNIGAKIGESVTCLSKGRFANDDDSRFTQELFYCLGVTKAIEEKLMNSATAISGSGPAYIFDFLEANSIDPGNIPDHTKHDIIRRLGNAAISVGFNREDAMFLAANITNSSVSLAKKTKISLVELKKQVTSKGGTTEAALEILHKGGSWEEAAGAAVRRAEQLSMKG